MKHAKKASLTAVLVLISIGTFWLTGYAGEHAPEEVNCNADIAWEVAKDVKLTQFDCVLGEHGGQTSLIFTVGLENPTEQPLRYRINIFLEDMDKAAGHLVPRKRKGKPPVVDPGKGESVKIPFIGTDKESKKILVIVKTISTE